MIEHIMRAVMQFSRRPVVLVVGRKVADGDLAEVVRNPKVERAHEPSVGLPQYWHGEPSTRSRS